MSVELSVVVPMYHEAANAKNTVATIVTKMQELGILYEIVVVDDGSKDHTAQVITDLTKEYPQLLLVQHERNYGRGRALRTGFAKASGNYIVSIDADLSYSVDHIVKIYQRLCEQPAVDIVLGSAYMAGGSVEHVPWLRKFLSRVGNRILSFAFYGRYKTATCMLRGYRRKALRRLQLDSDGKELHLEILTKAEDIGLSIAEIPAHLQSRKAGKSKFKFVLTATSHLLFSISERPGMLFGFGGFVMALVGVGIGGYIVVLWQRASLNPVRPLVTLMVLFILAGCISFFFGFLSIEIRYLKKELHNIRAKLAEHSKYD